MIDLVRLKEAMNEAQESEQGAGMALVGPAFELVDAVLDAPTVWWCEVDMAGRDHTEDSCVFGHPDAGCRMVALVPVTGEGR